VISAFPVYTGRPRKKRPGLSHGVMQQSRWSESAEKHVCNEQTSIKFHLNASILSVVQWK